MKNYENHFSKFAEITHVHPGSSDIIPSDSEWSPVMPQVILDLFYGHRFFTIFITEKPVDGHGSMKQLGAPLLDGVEGCTALGSLPIA